MKCPNCGSKLWETKGKYLCTKCEKTIENPIPEEVKQDSEYEMKMKVPEYESQQEKHLDGIKSSEDSQNTGEEQSSRMPSKEFITEDEPKKFPWKTVLISVFLVVIIGGTAAALYFFWLPNRMVKYTDSENGFSFSHPASWKELSEDEIKEDILDIFPEDSFGSDEEYKKEWIDETAKNILIYFSNKEEFTEGKIICNIQKEEFLEEVDISFDEFKEGMDKQISTYKEMGAPIDFEFNDIVKINDRDFYKMVSVYDIEEIGDGNKLKEISLIGPPPNEGYMYIFVIRFSTEYSAKLEPIAEKVIESFKIE